MLIPIACLASELLSVVVVSDKTFVVNDKCREDEKEGESIDDIIILGRVNDKC